MKINHMKKTMMGGFRKAASVLCAATLACGLVPAAAFAAPGGSPSDEPAPVDYEGGDIVDGEILVQLDDSHSGGIRLQSTERLMSSVERALDAESTETVVEASSENGSLVSVELPEGKTVSEAVAEAKKLPGVVHAQPNFKYHLLENISPDEGDGSGDTGDGGNAGDAADGGSTSGGATSDLFDDAYMGDQYYLGSWTEPQNGKYGANVANAWKIALSQHRVSVAILDTGIRVDHEDLQENIDTDNMWDAYTGTKPGTITSGSNPKGDLNGHGTHVAGIAAGVAGNGVGIAGASGNANIVPIKVFDNQASDPGAETTTLVKAYQYLLSRDIDGLHAVNMSLGSYNALNADDQALYSEIDKARAKGILTVCAGGNGDYTTNKPYTQAMYPSDFENVMSVTALEPDGSNATWSDYNAAKDISAPGVDIFSCYNASAKSYRTLDGTSMASPLVAGISSLLWAANPDLSVEQVENAIYSTANKIEKPDPGYNRNDEANRDRSGSHGAIDATAAVAEVANGSIANYKRMSSCAIDPISDVAWANSKSNRPESVVVRNKDTGETLVEGADYTLRISGDSKVGTAKVIAVGKGDYIGSIDATYNIRFDFATASGLNIVLSKSFYPADGKAHTPTVIGVHNRPDVLGTYSLEQDKDFKVTFPTDVTSEGTKTVKVVGMGNYMGERTLSYTIGKGSTPTPTPSPSPDNGSSPRADLSNSVISPIAAQVFTGGAIEPDLTVLTVSGAVLTKDVDYTVSFGNNVNVGKATVKVEGKGNYTGSVTGSFDIAAAPISAASFEAIPTQQGVGATPAVACSLGGKALKQGVDFDVEYRNNDKAGIGYAVVKGKGNLSDTMEIPFRIIGSNQTSFADVPSDAWYRDVVADAARLGLLTGYAGTDQFGPDDALTRGQVVTILARVSGVNLGDSASNATPFADNESGSWYTAAVNWAYSNGILSGYAGTSLVGPNDPVTREQLAKMICSWAESVGIDTTKASLSTFYGLADNASVSDWAVGAMAWATHVGIISGVDTAAGKMAAPQDTATRAQMAAMTLRALDSVYGLK